MIPYPAPFVNTAERRIYSIFWRAGGSTPVRSNRRYRDQKRKTGECLAAVCDFGEKNRTLELDLSGLGYKRPSVTNAESGKELPLKGQILKLELLRHDFRLLKIREVGSGK